MTDKLELVVGEVLEGKYRIERLLGVGGMGAVHLAKRTALGDRVAIKSILSTHDNEANRARFLREARAGAAIRHPNVVQVFDFGQPPGRPPYMVMEYLEGPTLSRVIPDNGLPIARALQLFAGICAAVEAGHRRNVVHRDLKPGNVILARSDDGRETVKVLDFGLARIAGDDISKLTNPGAMVGTCSYMAPELIESGQAAFASDIWALGVLLYELLTGQSPFRGATTAATIMKIVGAQYEPPSRLVEGLPPPVVAGIEAALALDPSERPASPEQLAALVGAPMQASASDSDFKLPPLVEVSAVGRPGEIEPSMLSRSRTVGEITLSDQGPNLEGGEKTAVPSEVPDAGRTEFVGREHELESLRREYRSSIAGEGRVVVVTGDAGVGKTALLDSFSSWARSQRAVVLRGRFFAYEGDRPPPYETFLWMLAEARSSASGHVMSRQNRPGGWEQPPDHGQDKWQMFQTMSRAFVEQAHGRPLVLGFDDLQWATALDLEFLAYLPRAADTAAIMIVGTARVAQEHGTELDRWMSRLGSQRALRTIEVERFGPDEVRTWFQAAFPGIRIRPQDLRRLQHATSGNPYYLTEVVRRLVDDGQIRRDEHGYMCESLDEVVLPETVNAVVRAKLEGLDESLRTALETAGVIGEEFRFETLQAALGGDEDELERQLEEAVKHGLLTEDVVTPGSDFRFDSATVRNVLYDSMGKRRRKRVHKAVVEAIERLYGEGDTARIAKVLCYHHAAVEDHPQTLEWGLRATRECLDRNDSDQAEIALARAREAQQALDKAGDPVDVVTRARVSSLTGGLYNRIGRLEEAQHLLEAALEELAGAEPVLELDILLDLVECQLGRGDFEGGVETGHKAIEAAQKLDDRRRELAARVATARCAAPRGRLEEAEALLRPVIDAPRDEELASIQALALAEQGWVHAKRGHFAMAEQAAGEGLALARQCDDLMSEYRAVSVLGLNYLEGGDQDSSIQYLEQALELARRLSLRRREGVELHNLGEAHYFQGRYDDALQRAHAALAIFVEVHDRATEGDCRVNIGRMLLAKGEAAEARAMLEHGLMLASGSGRSEYEGLALLELADLDLREDAIDTASRRLARAREVLEKIESLYLWRAELGLARLAAAQGDRDRAKAHVETALELLRRLEESLGPTMSRHSLHNSLLEVRDFEKTL